MTMTKESQKDLLDEEEKIDWTQFQDPLQEESEEKEEKNDSTDLIDWNQLHVASQIPEEKVKTIAEEDIGSVLDWEELYREPS